MFYLCLTHGALIRDKERIPFGWCFRTHSFVAVVHAFFFVFSGWQHNANRLKCEGTSPYLNVAIPARIGEKKILSLASHLYALNCTGGHKSHDPCFYKKYMEAWVMTFVNHCTFLRSRSV